MSRWTAKPPGVAELQTGMPRRNRGKGVSMRARSLEDRRNALAHRQPADPCGGRSARHSRAFDCCCGAEPSSAKEEPTSSQVAIAAAASSTSQAQPSSIAQAASASQAAPAPLASSKMASPATAATSQAQPS